LDKSIFAGEDVGVLMMDKYLVSESTNDRIALLISNGRTRTDVRFAHLDISEDISIGKNVFHIKGIDRERKENDLVKYTPYFHRTTLTDGNGLEIVVRKGKIVAISDGSGSSIIPADGFVISASGTFRDQLSKFARSGKKVSVRSGLDVSETEDIVAGIPQLIKDGKIAITWEREKTSKSFVETRHPRTAVAKLKNGKFLMVTVDGRSEASGGIGLQDLAEYLLELGAVDAMNLDGGGSTTMVLDGKVVNTPSDKEGERKIGDALIVRPRNN
jgi:exopolysaccharide biosynthesis protein